MGKHPRFSTQARVEAGRGPGPRDRPTTTPARMRHSALWGASDARRPSAGGTGGLAGPRFAQAPVVPGLSAYGQGPSDGGKPPSGRRALAHPVTRRGALR